MTDAAGEHYLHLDFDQSGEPAAGQRAGPGDGDGRQPPGLGGHDHPAGAPGQPVRGFAQRAYFVEQGTPLKVDFIVTDLDGKPVADRPVDRAGRAAGVEIPRRRPGRKKKPTCRLCELGSAGQPVTCTFETPVGGTYRITATVTDEQGRTEPEPPHPLGERREAPARARGGARRSHADPRQRNLPAGRRGARSWCRRRSARPRAC